MFDSEEAALKKILDGTVQRGDVIVIRYEGPRGGPGMREMLSPTSAVIGRGLGQDVALITDGNCIVHITVYVGDGFIVLRTCRIFFT